jgi:hypothetical protein
MVLPYKHEMTSIRTAQLFALTSTQTFSTNIVTGLHFAIRMCLEYALMNWIRQRPARVDFSAGRIPTGGATHVRFRTSQIVRVCSTCKKEKDDLLNMQF